MKRLSSLLLLLLILFNTIGYYGLLILVKQQHLERAIQKIDENQNEMGGNLILRIPVALPYGHDDEQYERTYGTMEYEGEMYHFVKQRQFHDVLYIICWRDQKGTEVKKALDAFSTTFADQNQKPGSNGRQIVSFAKFYVISELVTQADAGGWSQPSSYHDVENPYSFLDGSSIFHPPC